MLIYHHFSLMERDECSVEEILLMERWIVGSVPRAWSTELILSSAKGPQLDKQSLLYVLSCLWVGALHVKDRLVLLDMRSP